MNRKPVEERAKILNCLVEGNSIRGTARIMGCSKTTVAKLLVDVGKACEWHQDKHLVNLPCTKVQADEIWCIVGKKTYNKQGVRNHIGDVWTFTSICADTRLAPYWLVGRRDRASTVKFINELASRMSGKIQLTTDGYRPYLDAVEEAFGNDIDYAMLEKTVDKDGKPQIMKRKIVGAPDRKDVSTSYVERQNLTMRTNIKRFTRRTNAFSKKIENHALAVAMHFMYYNFARIHQTLRVSPAMEAGIADKLWSLEDIISMADDFAMESATPNDSPLRRGVPQP